MSSARSTWCRCAISPTAPASKLSGGQQQRVALARAIAFSPTVVLFDEPLSNLDAKLRAEMRVELRELQRRLDITSVYVTHDQEEALAISDRVIVMNVGVIEQIGTPEQIYNRPRSRFVADFVGSANLIKGQCAAAAATARCFEAEGGHVLQAIAPHTPRGNETEVAVRTAYIDLGPRPPATTRSPARCAGACSTATSCSTSSTAPPGQLIVRRPPTNLLDEGARSRCPSRPSIASCWRAETTAPGAPGDDHAVHQAPLAVGIVGVGLVHGAAVVPDHDVALPPDVAVLVFRLDRMRDQLIEQPVAFATLHARRPLPCGWD